MFRVNYGNGQVSQTFTSKAGAKRHIAEMDLYSAYAFIQRKMDGDWFQVKS